MSKIKTIQELLAKAPKEYNGIKFHGKVSEHDPNVYKHHILLNYSNKTVSQEPQITNNKALLPPCFNQGNLGTCTASSTAWGSKAYKEICQGEFPVDGFSASYLYAKCKEIDGNPSEAGTTTAIIMQALQKYGICTSDLLPYSWLITDVNVPIPPTNCDTQAGKYKINTYAQVCSPDDTDLNARIDRIRNAILTEGPIQIAIIVTKSFMTPTIPGYIVPKPEGSILGGHELCITDLDDNKRLFTIRNTWGSSWGDNGYCYMPYEWVTETFDPGNGEQIPLFVEAYTFTDIIIPTPVNKIQLTINSNIAIVDGINELLDQPAIIDSETNRTLVPLRFLGNALGLLIQYNAGQINLQTPNGNLHIQMALNSTNAVLNGNVVTLSQAPILDTNTNRTLIPVRDLAQFVGYNVDYDASVQTITITK